MTISTQCLECKHYTGLCTCEAFPDKIPQEIFDGTFDHINKYPGDNGIKFEKESNISKGEKIIHIKGSSKVKAHKRRIKISRDLDRIGDKTISHKDVISTNYGESIKNMNDYLSKLNENDEGKRVLESMEDYTIDSFVSINEYMKHGESETFKKTLPEGKIRGQKKYNVKDIKDSISNIKKFINDAPKFEGEVYRGFQYRTNNPESEMRWNNFIKSVEGLKEMKFGSFLSTSKDRVVATQFARRHSHSSMKNCLIIIKTKSGIPIKKISLIESEHEVLIDNDKIYKIIKFEKQDKGNHLLHLEEK